MLFVNVVALLVLIVGNHAMHVFGDFINFINALLAFHIFVVRRLSCDCCAQVAGFTFGFPDRTRLCFAISCVVGLGVVLRGCEVSMVAM